MDDPRAASEDFIVNSWIIECRHQNSLHFCVKKIRFWRLYAKHLLNKLSPLSSHAVRLYRSHTSGLNCTAILGCQKNPHCFLYVIDPALALEEQVRSWRPSQNRLWRKLPCQAWTEWACFKTPHPHSLQLSPSSLPKDGGGGSLADDGRRPLTLSCFCGTTPRGSARPSRAPPCHTAVVMENAITTPEGENLGPTVRYIFFKEEKHTCWREARFLPAVIISSDNFGISFGKVEPETPVLILQRRMISADKQNADLSQVVTSLIAV